MQYQVDAELSGKPLTEAEADHALEQLPGLSAVIADSHGYPDVLLTIGADDVIQATTLGVAVIERATARTVTAVHVMPTETWDARQGFVPIPELIGATEAATLLGVSRQRIAQLVDEGKLPARRAGNALVFARGTVEAYQSHRVPDQLAAAGAAVPEPSLGQGHYTGGAAIP